MVQTGKDEWVILLHGSAELEFKDNELIRLNPVILLNIPAYKEHRVTFTSTSPKLFGLHFIINESEDKKIAGKKTGITKIKFAIIKKIFGVW